jgi:hypothetical protein
MRRFPAPWSVEKIPGGFKVVDASGQSLTHVHPDNRQIVNSLTVDEAHREQHREAARVSQWCEIMTRTSRCPHPGLLAPRSE